MEVVPAITFPNAKEVGVTIARGMLPDSGMPSTGVLTALLLMVNVAVRVVVDVDVNVTLIEQVAAGATPEPRIGQVVNRVKSLEFVPLSVMLLMIRAKFPVFVTVMVCGVLFVNDRLAGAALITAPTPVPLREIV